MDRRGDDVAEWEGRRDNLGSHKSGDVGHVGHQNGAAAVGNLTETGVVQVAGVAGDAGDDETRPEQLGGSLQLFVVDQTRFRVHLNNHSKVQPLLLIRQTIVRGQLLK